MVQRPARNQVIVPDVPVVAGPHHLNGGYYGGYNGVGYGHGYGGVGYGHAGYGGYGHAGYGGYGHRGGYGFNGELRDLGYFNNA